MQWTAPTFIFLKCVLCALIFLGFAHARAEGPGSTYHGSYVGIAVGPGIITGNFTTDSISVDYVDTTTSGSPIKHVFSYAHLADDAALGAAGRISMGYGGCIFINCLYLGIEASAFQMTHNEVTEEFVESETIESSGGMNNKITLENTATASLGTGGGLDLKLGVLLTEEFLVYGLGGIVVSQVKLTAQSSLEPSSSTILGTANVTETEEHVRGGFHVGLGVEQKVSQRMSLILAYTYANYGKLEITQEAVTYSNATYGTGHLEVTNSVTVTQQEAWLGLNYYF